MFATIAFTLAALQVWAMDSGKRDGKRSIMAAICSMNLIVLSTIALLSRLDIAIQAGDMIFDGSFLLRDDYNPIMMIAGFSIIGIAGIANAIYPDDGVTLSASGVLLGLLSVGIMAGYIVGIPALKIAGYETTGAIFMASFFLLCALDFVFARGRPSLILKDNIGSQA